MQKNKNLEKIYYQLAILINEELYEEKIISSQIYNQTISKLLKKSEEQ